MNKKGVSAVVTYVLLIVVAIGLSAIVFGFLQALIQEPEFTCPEGLALVIKDVDCTSTPTGQLYITFQNKGRFEIDGVYARYSNTPGAVSSTPLVPIRDSGNTGGINEITDGQKEKGFFYFGRSIPSPLRPNAEYTQLFRFTSTKLEKIEIQPFLNLEDDRELGICEEKVITRTISC